MTREKVQKILEAASKIDKSKLGDNERQVTIYLKDKDGQYYSVRIQKEAKEV